MGFFSFAKNIGKNKYSQKSTSDAIKTASKRAVQKAGEASANLIDNKMSDSVLQGSSKKLHLQK